MWRSHNHTKLVSRDSGRLQKRGDGSATAVDLPDARLPGRPAVVAEVLRLNSLDEDYSQKAVLFGNERCYYKICYNQSMEVFKPDQLRLARETAGLTQQLAADRLGISQAYLALMETGRRRVTEEVGLKLMDLYHLGPTALPLGLDDLESWNSESLAKALASLGYPGFRHLAGGHRRNPAIVLLAALSRRDVEVRVGESLPWLVTEYYNLDWDWLIRESKVRDTQNRLGFIVTLGRRIAQKRGAEQVQRKLLEVEEVLVQARLAREDSLCQGGLSEAERGWLRRSRSSDARHWNLLTDLDAKHLPYAA